jgi:hypothetical protein
MLRHGRLASSAQQNHGPLSRHRRRSHRHPIDALAKPARVSFRPSSSFMSTHTLPPRLQPHSSQGLRLLRVLLLAGHMVISVSRQTQPTCFLLDALARSAGTRTTLLGTLCVAASKAWASGLGSTQVTDPWRPALEPAYSERSRLLLWVLPGPPHLTTRQLHPHRVDPASASRDTRCRRSAQSSSTITATIERRPRDPHLGRVHRSVRISRCLRRNCLITIDMDRT